MIVLGIILIVVGYLLPMSLLITIGIILLVVGAALWILGSTGHPIGGRARWY